MDVNKEERERGGRGKRELMMDGMVLSVNGSSWLTWVVVHTGRLRTLYWEV